MAQSILLIFPHQLFRDHPGLVVKDVKILLIEDSLFFGDLHHPLKFHKQKLLLHRASMKRYELVLQDRDCDVEYVEFSQCRDGLISYLEDRFQDSFSGVELLAVEPGDFLVRKRLERFARRHAVSLTWLENPGFLNSPQQNHEYRSSKSRWFMADFYKWQRTRLNVLMDGDQPVGGKWSFDEDNRKKIPKKLLPEIPEIDVRDPDEIEAEAIRYVEDNFSDHPGSIDQVIYPTGHDKAERWLQDFLDYRFQRFGDFEDAIVEGQSWLWHSVLTPMLNIGLLTPQQVLTAANHYAENYEIPLNSAEGFIRQIIGWREFMRATYEDLGVKMRTTNHWNHNRKIPESFWNATTSIPPIDDTIKRLLQTGYCHHIERLMVLGGFMFLCEFDPDEIYRWFMEMFVDSYDWVMVTNVYAMSQNADGGLITTKPYFSGSSYVRKMSHYESGTWCDIWDGLYWRWIWLHVDELAKNPRWAMMCSMAKKMDREKRERHLKVADGFLEQLV